MLDRRQGWLINAASHQLAQSEQPPDSDDLLLNSPGAPAKNNDDLLTETPIASGNGSDDLLPTASVGDELISGNDLKNGDDLLLGADKPAGNKSGEAADLLLGTGDAAPNKPVTKLVKGSTHLTSGGWYADQSTLSIRYMPIGHADRSSNCRRVRLARCS